MKKSLPIKKCLTITRAGIMEGMSFRASYFMGLIANLIYLITVYFLWKAIFASSPTDTVNGMTFKDTLIYLVLASSIFGFLETYIVFMMGRDIQEGRIVVDLVRPMDYKSYMFWTSTGDMVNGFVTTFIPTFVIVFFLTFGTMRFGVNIPLFLISLILAILINYNINFFVGTICLYTESAWGINMVKEVIVLLLSGATVPLAFFPDTLRRIVEFMPFQAIYNVPLQILINNNLTVNDYIMYFAVQIVWVVITSVVTRLFWMQSLKVITVNGG